MPSPEFFQVLPVAEALALLQNQWQPQPGRENIATADALDRVIAGDIQSPEAAPAFRKSTVDGYALRAADSFGATQSLPAFLEVSGEIKMGGAPDRDIQAGQCLTIHTGGMLPKSADAVAMIETTQALGEREIELMKAVAPGENVIQAGEDVSRGALVLGQHQRIRPQDIGALLAVGITEIPVLRPPRIGILSCGDELLPPDETPTPGKVRDINAYILSGLASKNGAIPLRLGISSDDLDDYRARARDGFQRTDILLLSAGSSVSARDYTRDVIDSLGLPGVLQHGLAIKPGKPTIIALCDNKPVIGLPGNPASALIVARQLLPSLIARFTGQMLEAPRCIRVRLGARVASVTGREDWLPLRLDKSDDDIPLARPIFGKSNLIFTLATADALLPVPLNTGGFDAGATVDALRF